MKILIIIVLILISTNLNAGGDYTSGYVTDFSNANSSYTFKYLQTNCKICPTEYCSEFNLCLINCREFSIIVHHERVPWFSWLPFIKSRHPTKKETEEAIKYIQDSLKKNEPIHFGVMGYGIMGTNSKCTFQSRGLRIINTNNENVVFSFYYLT